MDTLDTRALDSLLVLIGGDPAKIRRLVETFAEETPEIVRSMRVAAADGDAPSLHRGAHSVRTGARYMGAIRLEAIATRLESFARDVDAASAETWRERATAEISAIDTAFEEACRALERQLERRSDR